MDFKKTGSLPDKRGLPVKTLDFKNRNQNFELGGKVKIKNKFWTFHDKSFILLNHHSMNQTSSTKKNPKDFINVTVVRANHELVKAHLESLGDGRDIGKFYDIAAMEKLAKEKSTKK